MRIGIDARAYNWAGIGRYTRELLKALVGSKTEHEFVVITGEENVERAREDLLVNSDRTNDTPGESLRRHPGGETRLEVIPVESSYYSWKEQTKFLWELNNIDVDLWHFTHFNVPMFLNRPYVVTIHDVIRFIFPGQKQQKLMTQVMYEVVFKRAIENAKGVAFVSETTRNDVQGLPIKIPENSEVIYEGVDKIFAGSRISRHGLDSGMTSGVKLRMKLGFEGPYILLAGVWMGHKNLPRAIEAFARFWKVHNEFKLVITGKPVPGYSPLLKLVDDLSLGDDVVFPGFVEEHLMLRLYAEAEALMYVSLYEGFGLPPLEAAACGTPSVVANVGSVPEIIGDGGKLVNPEYVPDIVAGLETVVFDEVARSKVIREGKENVEKFSWEMAKQEHLALYERAFKM